jgi:phosphoglycerol transferase MdoB-like AlkP superfamily enzyme
MDVSGAGEWRRSPFGSHAGEDLSRFRGIAKGRNVLLVVLESTAARYLGLYGAPRDPMPGLSALAAQSIVVDPAYAAYPESVKGLFAVLCSRFPAFDTSPEIYARVSCPSLAGRLKEAGYRTALFHSGRFAYLGMRSMIDGRGFDRSADFVERVNEYRDRVEDWAAAQKEAILAGR